MSIENSGDVTYSEIGGLSEQIRELREVGISQWNSFSETYYSYCYNCQFVCNWTSFLELLQIRALHGDEHLSPSISVKLRFIPSRPR